MKSSGCIPSVALLSYFETLRGETDEDITLSVIRETISMHVPLRLRAYFAHSPHEDCCLTSFANLTHPIIHLIHGLAGVSKNSVLSGASVPAFLELSDHGVRDATAFLPLLLSNRLRTNLGFHFPRD